MSKKIIIGIGVLVVVLALLGIIPELFTLAGSALAGLGALLGFKKDPIVVEKQSKVEKVKLENVKEERKNLEIDLANKLEKANEKASNVKPPDISDLAAELERIRARSTRGK